MLCYLIMFLCKLFLTHIQIQQNLDGIITVDDEELVVAFLDMVENHKMVMFGSVALSGNALVVSDFGGNVYLFCK